MFLYLPCKQINCICRCLLYVAKQGNSQIINFHAIFILLCGFINSFIKKNAEYIKNFQFNNMLYLQISFASNTSANFVRDFRYLLACRGISARMARSLNYLLVYITNLGNSCFPMLNIATEPFPATFIVVAFTMAHQLNDDCRKHYRYTYRSHHRPQIGLLL